MTCRTFLEKSNVYAICITDDPIDNLEYHQELKTSWPVLKVISNFRPDKVMKINTDGFGDYIAKLSSVSGTNIKDYDSLMNALKKRINFYDQMGGKTAEHGLKV
ncbi:hypothetical protein P344_01385 [Spiroplasma mirum ATCC 29335]|uniref:Uronate isomerase n=1 Tax=Spiroplasma mirum ATCC 29335 TaxID=838561 RepID=W6AKE2_9MOLU|nr:glucuronate isomerase [Spiroplasma mirum]AHI57642.1 hypothetical protein P344_01385 [Spiroplasma mirum ATCC 29335]